MKTALKAALALLVATAAALAIIAVTERATPEPDPPATPEGGDPPYLRNAEAKTLMLEAINAARRSQGQSQLKLGTSDAPQLHAEDMLAHCYTSHWDRRGRKPYTRDRSAGGQAAFTTENIYSSAECGFEDAGNERLPRTKETITSAVNALLRSPGHRDNMLNPDHQTVSLGIASDTRTFKAVQQFEQHLATPLRPLSLSGDTLSLSLVFTPPAEPGHIFVLLAHDPQDTPLTRGQLDRSSCYEGPRPIAAVLKTGLHNRSAVETTRSYDVERSCPEPQDTDPEAAPAQSAEDAARLKEEARDQARKTKVRLNETTYVNAYRWEETKHSLDFATDISALTKSRGRGYYTAIIVVSAKGGNRTVGEWTVQKRE